MDQQVKIPGFRIELGEIEVELRKHPSVREAVANAYQPPSGDKHLVAYIVKAPGEKASIVVPKIIDAMGCLYVFHGGITPPSVSFIHR